jgi:hypothetical protein
MLIAPARAGKKATQNAGEPLTTAAALSAAATVSAPAIQPRAQTNHDTRAWAGLAGPPTLLPKVTEKAAWSSKEMRSHPSTAAPLPAPSGPPDQDEDLESTPTAANNSRTMQGESDAVYLGPDATVTGLLRQIPESLTPSLLQPQ